MKNVVSLSASFLLIFALCQMPLAAQSRRRAESSMSVALPVPPAEESPAGPSNPDETDEGKTFECVEDDARASAAPAAEEKKEEEVFLGADVTKRAEITDKPQPVYSREARMNGTSGRVRVRALLSSKGRVTKVSVLRGLPDGLSRSAVAAACKLEFKPAVKDGQPVSQYVTLEYGFHTDDRPFFIYGRPAVRPTMRPLPNNFAPLDVRPAPVAAPEELPTFFPRCLVPRFRIW